MWLVFFKFKWLTFSIAWGVVSVFFGLHLLIIFTLHLALGGSFDAAPAVRP